MAEGAPREPDEAGMDPDTVFTITRRPGEMAAPGEYATLRLAEALLAVRREHPEAWRILRRAGVILNEPAIERLVAMRDNPKSPVEP